MTLPSATTIRSVMGSAQPTWLTQDVPNSYSDGQVLYVGSLSTWLEIDQDGNLTDNPAGTSGPFLIVLDFGLPTEEHCWASGVDIEAGTITVYSNGEDNGRGADGTAISAHEASDEPGVFPIFGGVDWTQVNHAVAEGSGGTTLSLTWGDNTFDVPVAALPAGWSGSGNASIQVELTTGPDLVNGLEDQNGNPIPDGWSFPAIVFIEGSTIFDIVAVNPFFPGSGALYAWNGPGPAVAAINFNDGIEIQDASGDLFVLSGGTALVAGGSEAVLVCGSHSLAADGNGIKVVYQGIAENYLFAYNGNPNGNVTAILAGDTCFTPSGPWYASAPGDSNWTQPTGGIASVTVNSGPLDTASPVSLVVTKQPLVPSSGIIQPLPPLIGFEFPGTFLDYGLPSGSYNWICAGPDGSLWAPDTNGNIVRITTDGDVDAFALEGAVAPYGVCAGPDGNVWVADQSGAAVFIVSPDGSSTRVPIGNDGVLQGICAGSDGNVWVANGFPDGGSGLILWQITPEGTPTPFGPFADSQYAYSICAGPDGNLWVPDYDYNTMFVIATNGTLVNTFPIGAQPNWLCVGPDKALWITVVGGAVVRMTVEGDVGTFPLGEGVNAQGIITGPGGDLWVADVEGSQMWKLTVLGAPTPFPMPFGAFGIAVGADGGLWLVGANTALVFPFRAKVGQLELDGGPLTTKVLTLSEPYGMTGVESVVITSAFAQLPSPSVYQGAQFTIKDSGSGTASVVPNASETIDGQSSITLSAYEAVTVTSDGTNWWVLSQVAASVL